MDIELTPGRRRDLIVTALRCLLGELERSWIEQARQSEIRRLLVELTGSDPRPGRPWVRAGEDAD
jgi:hypothetical protein